MCLLCACCFLLINASTTLNILRGFNCKALDPLPGRAEVLPSQLGLGCNYAIKHMDMKLFYSMEFFIFLPFYRMFSFLRIRACEGADNGVAKLQCTKCTLGMAELLRLASASNGEGEAEQGKTVSNR